ncbi:MAG: hypothetical protein FWG08_00035 [Propionibacteriaceae bacterium]|jgi:hypothetical protein|nr:hypothetical protein [Propionibacteriaceae bacterium]
MDEQVAEVVAVQANSFGVPLCVNWRGQNYRVLGNPTPWIDRAPWWSWSADHLPRVVEQAMWSVTLAPLDHGEIIQAELSVTGGDWWQLERLRD